jgi:chromosome segregation ATPase
LLIYDIDGYPLIGLPFSSSADAAKKTKKPPLPPAAAVLSEALQKRREQRTVENKALVQEVINLNNSKEVDELKKEIGGLEAKVAVFQAEAEASQVKVEYLTGLQKSQVELKLQADILNEEKKSLQQQINNLDIKLLEANEKLLKQKVELEDRMNIQGESASLRTANDTLQATIADFEKKIRHLENVRIPELQILLNSEKDDAERHKTGMENLQSELDIQNAKIQGLYDEIDKYKTYRLENDRCDELCANQKRQIESLLQACDKHKRTIEANRLTISNSATTLKNAEDRFDVERKQLSDALANALEKLHTVERLNHELLKKVEDSAPLISQVEALSHQLRDEQLRFETTVVAKDQAIRQLEKRLRHTMEERDQARSNMQGFNDRESELYRKIREGDLIRRQMHSRIMQLMGNIRVFVRVRPQLKHEAEGKPTVFSFPDTCDEESNVDLAKSFLEIMAPHKDRGGLSDRRTPQRFGFDRVFGPNTNQEGVWEAVEPLIQCVVDGSSVTIFAYGPTGSGVSSIACYCFIVLTLVLAVLENLHHVGR